MSCASTYVKCQDGKYYKNLIYRDKRLNWFICFDDNDPVELVIKKNPGMMISRLSIKKTHEFDPEAILRRLKVPFIRILKPYMCKRSFGDDDFHDSICYFVEVRNALFMKPRKHDTHDGCTPCLPTNDLVCYGER
jgi:hypothetical protein